MALLRSPDLGWARCPHLQWVTMRDRFAALLGLEKSRTGDEEITGL